MCCASFRRVYASLRCSLTQNRGTLLCCPQTEKWTTQNRKSNGEGVSIYPFIHPAAETLPRFHRLPFPSHVCMVSSIDKTASTAKNKNKVGAPDRQGGLRRHQCNNNPPPIIPNTQGATQREAGLCWFVLISRVRKQFRKRLKSVPVVGSAVFFWFCG